ncbi:MAG TPA: polysaccharide deacetylase family protein [Pyrinomonadaceae bacterium]|jgi:peptidoglycan/xylan/chitin deacetylase (PgdA/CDA1 family)
MLKKFKQATLKSLKSAGIATLVQNSRWRRQRLLILAYHGISLSDEHLWNGSHYMSADVFRARLELLRKSRCVVLPLAEALERLHANDLPDRAVAITFDDGTSDFYTKAFPLLKEFEFPATLYLTTFYSLYQKPVFDLMCSYVLWKGRDETLDLKKITGRDLRTELRDGGSRDFANDEIRAFALGEKLSAEEKDALAASLAKHLKVDYDVLLEQRIMHLLRAEDVTRLAAEGVDVQLHTHRHRTPMDPKLFLREIEDNRASIRGMTGRLASHFCYPSGVYDFTFLPWLQEAGIVSATTCEPGFASRGSNQLLLPRLLDTNTFSPIEFEGWLTGVSAALPRRNVRVSTLIQDPSF